MIAERSYVILVVEDEEGLNKLICKILRRAGYKTRGVFRGESVCENPPEQDFLLLLDYRLPDMRGDELVNRMKEICPAVPFVMITNNDDHQVVVEMMRAGARDFLLKDRQFLELLPTIVDRVVRELETERNLTLARKEADRAAERLLRQSTVSPVTGLPNRNQLELDLALREEVNLAIVDINAFSDIIHAYGLDMADCVLRSFAEVMAAQLDDDFQLYHLGADEFAVLAPSRSDVEARAADWMQFFSKNYVRARGVPVHTLISTGLAIQEKEDPLKKAILALSLGRKSGRHSNKFQEHGLAERYRENLERTVTINEALKIDAFLPHFQGIVDNRSGRIEKYECLARMRSGEEILGPGYFLAALERLGALDRLTIAMLEKSCRLFAGTAAQFSVNLSGADFRRGDLPLVVEKVAGKYDIAPSRITFEILEDVIMETGASDQLAALKGLGCRLAIDDFGTDYSNFARLLKMNADSIKIDGSFVRDVDSNPENYKICKSIKDFAHSMGIPVVAEFVHNQSVQNTVVELGIDYSQGFFFGKPMSADSFTTWPPAEKVVGADY